MDIEMVFAISLLIVFFVVLRWIEREPYAPSTLFNTIVRTYRRVESGKMSFFAFKKTIQGACSYPKNTDSEDTVRFKQDLLYMLEEEDFIKGALSIKDISIGMLYRLWGQYDPDMEYEQSEIPPEEISPSEDSSVDTLPADDYAKGKAHLLSSKEGKEMLEKLVSLGYCEPDTYRWKEEHSSYLMALFAYAIMQELGHRRGDWAAFRGLWCSEKKNNLTTLRDQALGAKKSKIYIETVKKVFPKFNPEKK